MPRPAHRPYSLTTRVTCTMLALTVLGLWSLSTYAIHTLREDSERMLGQQQLSTVSVLAAAIDAALDEQAATLTLLARALGPDPLRDPVALERALPRLDQGRLFTGGVVVYDRDGKPVLATGLARETLARARDTSALAGARNAADLANPKDMERREPPARPAQPQQKQRQQRQQRQPEQAGDGAVIGPLAAGAAMLPMTVALTGADGRPVGALSGMTDLRQANFLDRITSAAHGRTGGYMIVDPRQRLIVAASSGDQRLTPMPAPGADALVDRFIGGYEGSGIALNPAGIEVLASARRIAAVDWYVAAALPTAEAFAPVQAMRRRLLLATVGFALLLGGLTWWTLRRQLTPVQAAIGALAGMRAGALPLQPLPVARDDEIGRLIGAFNHLLGALEERGEALRIAAISFESQEGIVVLDAAFRILRVNHAFGAITGYGQREASGRSINLLRSERHTDAFYRAMWERTARDGTWRGEMWQRRRDGAQYFARGTVSAVRDGAGALTHYVCHLADATESKRRKEQRLRQEAAHREILIREVHHRIKNNLQGISGILSQSALKWPALAEPIRQCIAQVKGMSVVHGLHGRAEQGMVRLCELTAAIAQEVSGLWNTRIRIDQPPAWQPCHLSEQEAVPIALVLNELIVNAVKHGGRGEGINISLRKAGQPDRVQISIRNRGTLAAPTGARPAPYSGLQLVAALMPRSGARLHTAVQGEHVLTSLDVGPPTLFVVPGKDHA